MSKSLPCPPPNTSVPASKQEARKQRQSKTHTHACMHACVFRPAHTNQYTQTKTQSHEPYVQDKCKNDSTDTLAISQGEPRKWLHNMSMLESSDSSWTQDSITTCQQLIHVKTTVILAIIHTRHHATALSIGCDRAQLANPQTYLPRQVRS